MLYNLAYKIGMKNTFICVYLCIAQLTKNTWKEIFSSFKPSGCLHTFNIDMASSLVDQDYLNLLFLQTNVAIVAI